MLKILKYDWKNGWNSVRLPLLGAVILSALFGGLMGLLGGHVVVEGRNFQIFSEGSMDTAIMVVSLVWFAVMVALLVLTVDAIFRNMSGRMFGAEGCLTHTLPVDTWELLLGKAVGTWLFGVFMLFFAFLSVMLVFCAAVVSTGDTAYFISAFLEALPKLGEYHFRQLMTGAGYMLFAFAGFLAGSFLLVVQLQFICIAGRLFGRYHVAGGCAVFWLLCTVEGNLNQAFSMGFVIVMLTSAACFFGSHWVLKHKLSV